MILFINIICYLLSYCHSTICKEVGAKKWKKSDAGTVASDREQEPRYVLILIKEDA